MPKTSWGPKTVFFQCRLGYGGGEGEDPSPPRLTLLFDLIAPLAPRSMCLALCRILRAGYGFLCPLADLPLAAGEPSLLSSQDELVAWPPSLRSPQLSAPMSSWPQAAGWHPCMVGSCPPLSPGCLVTWCPERSGDALLLYLARRSFRRSDPMNPYHVGSGYVFAPATSANDSEISSDALTDDSMSMTDSSV